MFSKSTKTYIRREKARIRKEAQNPKEQKELVDKLFERIAQQYAPKKKEIKEEVKA